jgi:hypothetical protein
MVKGVGARSLLSGILNRAGPISINYCIATPNTQVIAAQNGFYMASHCDLNTLRGLVQLSCYIHNYILLPDTKISDLNISFNDFVTIIMTVLNGIFLRA